MSKQTSQQKWIDQACALASAYGTLQREFVIGGVSIRAMDEAYRALVDQLSRPEPHTQLLSMAAEKLKSLAQLREAKGVDAADIRDLIASIKQTIGEQK